MKLDFLTIHLRSLESSKGVFRIEGENLFTTTIGVSFRWR